MDLLPPLRSPAFSRISNYSSSPSLSFQPRRDVVVRLPPARTLMADTSSYGSQAWSSEPINSLNSWPKSDYSAIESDAYYAGPGGAGAALGSSAGGSHVLDRRQQHQALRVVSPAVKRTSKYKTNLCDVEGCGKLFRRSGNCKAHMETHNKKREYPFACTYGDCTKMFVRKTDLKRHDQSDFGPQDAINVGA
ncbi:hypothetical protein F5Y17DRAFT_463918 [Xylariaceae sp. FL0594]|nr:hypothetical protein F5Y17DRAFT_463918 [Xylariaceae sp. FL0594]